MSCSVYFNLRYVKPQVIKTHVNTTLCWSHAWLHTHTHTHTLTQTSITTAPCEVNMCGGYVWRQSEGGEFFLSSWKWWINPSSPGVCQQFERQAGSRRWLFSNLVTIAATDTGKPMTRALKQPLKLCVCVCVCVWGKRRADTPSCSC